MTTNLNAIAGPSKLSPHPRIDPDSPSSTGSDTKDHLRAFVSPEHEEGKVTSSGSILKGGMAVDENGEMVKVPAFLQKLYTMVSDNTTDKLIYWSESGDSFFGELPGWLYCPKLTKVPDHERFGKELLPRFFKHSNFSSFVRQLNMYGFHKVPQPQTGVLKVDNPSDSELWEFINPYFKRDQKELLHKVTRKNNRPNAAPISTNTATRSSTRNANSNQFLITDGTTEGEASAGPLISPAGQMVDLAAITNGINAIRQTQATIGADLKALQASNEHLWREALESRERHRGHQETIDLIVSFLERLFGTEGEGLKGLKEALRRGGIGRPREDSGSEEVVGKKRKRLGVDRMISDGREDLPMKDDQIIEIPDDPFSSSSSTFSSSNRFQTLPSEDGNTPKRFPSVEPSRVPTPSNPFATPQPGQIDPTALVPYFNQAIQNANSNSANPNGSNGGGNNSNANGNAPPLSPNSATAAASAFNLDPALLQTSIGSLLQSPAAAQMFLNSLTHSAQGQALSTPRGSVNFGAGAPGGVNANSNNPNQLQNQQNNYFANLANPANNSQFDPNAGGTGFTPQADPTLALLSPLPNYQALAQNNEALLKSYEDAMAVGGDVEKLQEGIDSLVRSLGLQPADGAEGNGGGYGMNPTANLGGNANGQQGGTSGQDGMGGMAGLGGMGGTADAQQAGLDFDSDFNVDDFLERLGKEAAEDHQ